MRRLQCGFVGALAFDDAITTTKIQHDDPLTSQ